MASIETRKTKGKITRYRVKWRTGGTRDGAWDGTTFDAHYLRQISALTRAEPRQRSWRSTNRADRGLAPAQDGGFAGAAALRAGFADTNGHYCVQD